MRLVFIRTIIVILVAAALPGCKRGEQKPSESADAPASEVAVKVGKLTRATLHRYVIAYGMVEPEPAHDGIPAAGARLAPALPGIVAEVSCAEGGQVEKGAVLFRLDSRPVDVAIQFATETYERQKKLLPAGGASQKSLQDAQQQLMAARTQRELLTVTAPFTGIITRVNSRPGEAVDLTSVLGEMVDPNRLVATANVPASELDGLKTGQSVEFTVRDRPLERRGTLSFVSLQVDPKTGAALVRASVPADCGLRAGQFVQLRIVTSIHTNCLAAPEESVVKDISGKSVLSLVQKDEAVQTAVQTGFRENGWVEVAGPGLKEGDTVVTVGAYGLPEKTKITVVRPSTPEASDTNSSTPRLQ